MLLTSAMTTMFASGATFRTAATYSAAVPPAKSRLIIRSRGPSSWVGWFFACALSWALPRQASMSVQRIVARTMQVRFMTVLQDQGRSQRQRNAAGASISRGQTGLSAGFAEAHDGLQRLQQPLRKL